MFILRTTESLKVWRVHIQVYLYSSNGIYFQVHFMSFTALRILHVYLSPANENLKQYWLDLNLTLYSNYVIQPLSKEDMFRNKTIINMCCSAKLFKIGSHGNHHCPILHTPSSDIVPVRSCSLCPLHKIPEQLNRMSTPAWASNILLSNN